MVINVNQFQKVQVYAGADKATAIPKRNYFKFGRLIHLTGTQT